MPSEYRFTLQLDREVLMEQVTFEQRSSEGRKEPMQMV